MADTNNLDGTERESEKTAPGGIGSLTDLGLGLFDRALAKPYNATLGLVLPNIDLSNSYDHHSFAAKAGDFGGSIIDLVALSKVAGWGVNKGLGWSAEQGLISTSLSKSPMLASTLTLGTTGALYEGVFTPGSGTTRMKNAAVGFATFGALGMGASALGRFAVLGEAGSRTFLQEVAVGGLSGIPAGIANAEATSLVNGNGLTFDAGTLGKSALYYGAFGAVMGGASHGLTEAVLKGRSWLSGSSAEAKSGLEVQPSSTEAAVAKTRIEPQPASSEPAAATIADATTAKSQSAPRFNIPETGNVELGRLMRETPPEHHTQLLREVLEKHPNVPMGSWMRLIASEDMPNFLRASDALFPDTALRNASYLIETQNLRPPTPESAPIDFGAWQRALELVRSEKAPVTPATAEKDAMVAQISGAAEKPFTFADVTMTVRDPALLKQAIANNAESALGSRILDFANRWATVMEGKMAKGEALTAEMARQADREVGMDLKNYEFDIARNVLVDTWKHGLALEKAAPSMAITEAELVGGTAPGARPPELTVAQQAELENFGSVMLSLANSRADAINMVRGIEPTNIDPVVRTALLDTLLEGKAFMRQMGVDSAESIGSVVRAMKNVPEAEIPRFVHYADQFRHETWQNSVMSQMDQAVAKGNIQPGTQQAWFDALSAKLRRVFPGIAESEWAISTLKR